MTLIIIYTKLIADIFYIGSCIKHERKWYLQIKGKYGLNNIERTINDSRPTRNAVRCPLSRTLGHYSCEMCASDQSAVSG